MHRNGRGKWYLLWNSRPAALVGAPDGGVERTLLCW